MFAALLDTCVLYPPYLSDTLLRLAEADLYRPLWSADILEELERNLIRNGYRRAATQTRVSRMCEAFPEAEVAGYQGLIEGMTNDPKDRHVLAAAVRGGAGVIVTANLRDFPAAALDPYDIEAKSPDDFLLDQLDLAPGLVLNTLHRQVARYQRPPRDLAALLNVLERAGAPLFANEIRRRIS